MDVEADDYHAETNERGSEETVLGEGSEKSNDEEQQNTDNVGPGYPQWIVFETVVAQNSRSAEKANSQDSFQNIEFSIVLGPFIETDVECEN